MRIKEENRSLARAKIKEYQASNAREVRELTPARLRAITRRSVRQNYPELKPEEVEQIVALRLARGMTAYVVVDVPVRRVEKVWRVRRDERRLTVRTNRYNR